MVIFGKLVGALIGGLTFGPLGLVIGIIAGHYFDKGLELNMQSRGDSSIAQQVFFKTTFMIMAHIAKADGRISENEIQMARDVMTHLQLNPDQKAAAIEYFNQGKSPNFNADAILDNFIRTCGRHPQLVHMFVEIQLQAAFVEGLQNVRKRRAMEHLCDKLGIPHAVLDQLERQSSRAYQRSHTERPRQRYSAQDDLKDAYDILGVSASATHQEVKKAYRLLMSQNHPDKLVAKGLPEEMIKVATEKTQKIQKAYEVVCESRGI